MRFSLRATAFAIFGLVPMIAAADPGPVVSPPPAPAGDFRNDEEQRRQTAVALNYCRAAFHRIQSCPSKRVLIEERERILNNLNLNVVADQEVVKLYAAVLCEISEIKIAEKEEEIIRGRHKREFRRRAIGSAVSFSLQMAAGNYMQALRTGASTWWDYRTMVWNRELDLWQIEKIRMKAINDKSTLFLDTFWKLTRKRDIPDRWLIRADDLDKLDAALREADPKTRLRVLLRMEPFMQCYPPYWYYVGRTQQALGKMDAAAATYRRLEDVGNGHFRKDELLAAALANLAAIEDAQKKPSAGKTALRALSHVTDAWQVNLIAAAVLNRHALPKDAEDALLRNLDVGLETEQSLTALMELYCQTKQTKKIEAWLQKPETRTQAAVPTLLRCINLIGDTPDTAAIRKSLAGSIGMEFDRHFGPDDLVFQAAGNWSLNQTWMSLSAGQTASTRATVTFPKEKWEARFRGFADLGSVFHPVAYSAPITLSLKYPDGSTVHVSWQRDPRLTAGYRLTTLALAEAASKQTTSPKDDQAPQPRVSPPIIESGRREVIASPPKPVRKPRPTSTIRKPPAGTDLLPPPPRSSLRTPSP